MSIQADMHLDHQAVFVPTADEAALVEAFKFGHLTLEALWAKLGLRALHVCAHFGILSTMRQATPDVSPFAPADLDLTLVPTDVLRAELARRATEGW